MTTTVEKLEDLLLNMNLYLKTKDTSCVVILDSVWFTVLFGNELFLSFD